MSIGIALIIALAPLAWLFVRRDPETIGIGPMEILLTVGIPRTVRTARTRKMEQPGRKHYLLPPSGRSRLARRSTAWSRQASVSSTNRSSPNAASAPTSTTKRSSSPPSPRWPATLVAAGWRCACRCRRCSPCRCSCSRSVWRRYRTSRRSATCWCGLRRWDSAAGWSWCCSSACGRACMAANTSAASRAPRRR